MRNSASRQHETRPPRRTKCGSADASRNHLFRSDIRCASHSCRRIHTSCQHFRHAQLRRTYFHLPGFRCIKVAPSEDARCSQRHRAVPLSAAWLSEGDPLASLFWEMNENRHEFSNIQKLGTDAGTLASDRHGFWEDGKENGTLNAILD